MKEDIPWRSYLLKTHFISMGIVFLNAFPKASESMKVQRSNDEVILRYTTSVDSIRTRIIKRGQQISED
mgnify:FL=1